MEKIILISDIQDYTKFCNEKVETSKQIIENLFEEIGLLLENNGCKPELQKRVRGDEFLAFFGSEDKAISAAIKIQEYLGTRSEDSDRPEKPHQLLLRIAIHRGIVDDFTEGTHPSEITGSGIIFVSRLLNIVDVGQIFLSKAVRDKVSDEMVKSLNEKIEKDAFYSNGEFQLDYSKTEIFELLWRKDQEPKFGMFEKYFKASSIKGFALSFSKPERK